MPFDQSSFLKRWRAAIKEAGQRNIPSFQCWEGPKAYKDLKRAGLLNFVQFQEDTQVLKKGRVQEEDQDQEEVVVFRGEQDWRSKQIFRDFEAAVAVYEADVHELSNLNRQEPVIGNFANVAKALTPLTSTQCSRRIRDAATKLLKLLEDEMSRRERANRQKRDEAFFAWFPGLSTAMKEYVTAPRRDYDLDSRFQLKIAFLLNFRLRGFRDGSRGVSFRTISRLVVLFYIASNLATYVTDPIDSTRRIETVLTKKINRAAEIGSAAVQPKRIRVQTVDQNLRRVKLDKCDGPRNIPETDRFWLR